MQALFNDATVNAKPVPSTNDGKFTQKRGFLLIYSNFCLLIKVINDILISV